MFTTESISDTEFALHYIAKHFGPRLVIEMFKSNLCFAHVCIYPPMGKQVLIDSN